MVSQFVVFACVLFASVQPRAIGSAASSSESVIRKVVVGVDGGTESIRACCFDAANGSIVGSSYSAPYPTFHPKAGWAEQNPSDWYDSLGSAVRGALATAPRDEVDVRCICLATTCCSVVALDSKQEPLRPSLLWMDARAAPQAREIFDKCRGDPALDINSGGHGPLSAEWMTPKALWIKQNEPHIWDDASTVCDYQDYLNFRLTGVLCASSCTAAARWHWNGQGCDGGRPMSMYRSLGIPELATKLPTSSLPMGALVGKLTKQAAQHLSLPEGLPVAQGGPDAYVGMIGLGCIHPGQLCLITGSSHLHCFVTLEPTTVKGMWGAYPGAPLPGINFAEGGQSSTGSILRWAKNLFGNNDLDYTTLDDEAARLPPGSDGVIALETFQGSRTPITDPLARGALVGLTLSHSRAHIWRSLMEAVCYGTRACIDGLTEAGHECKEIILAGGITKSPLWLQMHADVMGKPVVLCENNDAPLLGCAILASVGAGIYDSVENAVHAMVRAVKRIEPNDVEAREYTRLYEEVYCQLGRALQPVMHTIANLRGGGGCESCGRRGKGITLLRKMSSL